MRKHRLNKKAFTLVELCIVIALISIVMLLMTSFMAIFQPRTAQNQVRHDFLDEVSLVRDEMQKWVTNADAANTIFVNKDGYLLVKGEPAMSDFVEFSDGTISFDYSNDSISDVSYELKTIKFVDLEVYAPESVDADGNPIEPPANSGKLLKCTFRGFDTYGVEFSQTVLFSLISTRASFVSGQPAE